MADEATRPVGTSMTDVLNAEADQTEEELKRLQAGESQPPQADDTPPTPVDQGGAPEPVTQAAPAPQEPVLAAVEDKPKQGEGWRLARQKEREAREAAERAAHWERIAREYEAKERGTPQAQNQVPDFNTDPASNLLHRAETADQRMARLEQEAVQTRQLLAQQQELDAVRAQEAAFLREHPDYPQAVQHLVNAELEDFRMGPKQVAMARLNQALMGGDQMIKSAVDTLAAQGMDEDSALGAIAENTYINGRAAQLREAARVMGKPVPELGYAFAQRRGFQSKNGGGAPATSAAPPQTAAQAEAALARVRQAQKISQGAQTLSEMDTTAPAEAKRYTRSQVLAMSDAEIDAMNDGDPMGGWFKEN